MKIIAYFILVKVFFILSFCLAEAENIVFISVGITNLKSHACAVSERGQVWCWRYGTHGQLGNGKSILTSQRISPDYQEHHPVKINIQSKNSFFLETISSISAGSNHTCTVSERGRVWCWGIRTSGQLGEKQGLFK